ncbi:hypothetical protein ABZ667_09140 [Streptomyces lavendulae]
MAEAVTAYRQAACVSSMRNRQLVCFREQPQGLMLTDCRLF